MATVLLMRWSLAWSGTCHSIMCWENLALRLIES